MLSYQWRKTFTSLISFSFNDFKEISPRSIELSKQFSKYKLKETVFYL